LNPELKRLTIPLDQISTKSKVSLLPNGEIVISDWGSQRKENEDTYNLSTTCGFDSIAQLMAVTTCDSIKLLEQVVELENIRRIELAIAKSKTNVINKHLLNNKF